MKNIVTGILAHVDAGKTTLSESFLYLSGTIRKLGRVDHQDAFLDTYSLERARGITIFSKQAVFDWKELGVTLLDTPGHVDFSPEMERTLQVLDYAILIISGSDGVQGHTETLWKLLERYNIPVFVFINKMDLANADKNILLTELKRKLSDCCIDFSGNSITDSMADTATGYGYSDEFLEAAALCDEKVLEKYMETGTVSDADISSMIADRKIFPVYCGSALKLEGITALLDGLNRYAVSKAYPSEFGAKVYKISRDEQGTRITHLKLTGGKLRVKDKISGEQKAEQLRIYNGTKFKTAEAVSAGNICAVTGLTDTYPGQGLGIEQESDMPLLMPVMNYRLILPDGTDPVAFLPKLKELMEEEPLLHVTWKELLWEIHVQLMGNVQIEILKSLIKDRFNTDVGIDEGSIVYRETIASKVTGMGHYEPLRHYAEAHILMEPGEPGSGITLDTACSEDVLDRNWQRLILTHIEEKEHTGVLTGAPITDIKFTLIAGRAHQKHTEGGDFRQATYRAIRHGLMHAVNVLLEPVYEFKMELPSENIGRAMSDIERMCGKFLPPEITENSAILYGTAPVSELQGYSSELISYTKGRGRLTCTMKGYEPCHNAEEVIRKINYNAEADTDNSADSVFCSHGAGFLVPWQQAAEFMHIKNTSGTTGTFFEYAGTSLSDAAFHTVSADRVSSYSTGSTAHLSDSRAVSGSANGNDVHSSGSFSGTANGGGASKPKKSTLSPSLEADKELEAIFERTYGPVKTRLAGTSAALGHERTSSGRVTLPPPDKRPEYLLVDGYNVIFAWEELEELARENLDAARLRLMDILCNYQGFTKTELILVFDAYKVKGNPGEVSDYHNIHIVYTKEAETADMYIEKVTHEIGRQYRVTVATSDRLEQLIIAGQGAVRMSSREFKEEVERITSHKLREFTESNRITKNYLLKEAIDKLDM